MSVRAVAALPLHPGLQTHAERRRASRQNRIADAITAFAGSMKFVYAHVVWFALWVLANEGVFGKSLVFDEFPFGLLTMIVSLEAIFLSTFVMISQNRADERRESLANAEWDMVKVEEEQNEQLLALTNKILELTTAIRDLTLAHTGESPGRG
jgi:uncharacterized membrane protein